MSNKNEIRKLEGERKRLMQRVGKIDIRIGQLGARDVVVFKKNKPTRKRRGNQLRKGGAL
jgi:hypothetical protein